jgi:hypothetical protein
VDYATKQDNVTRCSSKLINVFHSNGKSVIYFNYLIIKHYKIIKRNCHSTKQIYINDYYGLEFQIIQFLDPIK